MNLKLSRKEINYTLFGLVLGDGYYKDGVICVRHTNKQRFYIQWLERLCKHLKLKHKVRYDFERDTTLGRFEYSEIKIWVPDRRHFDKFGRVYDANGKKVPSKYVLRRVTPLGLLLWYLDDGQLHVSFRGTKAKRFAYLNTQSFTYEQNRLIQQMLKDRFGIETRIHKNGLGIDDTKAYYRLYFNAENFRKFYDLVREYLSIIPKEFRYKFNMQYVPNRLSKSAEYARLYNCN